MAEVNERITTVEDGPTTVNERLSPGGPGPEGQPDTAKERLSGTAESAPAVVEEPAEAAVAVEESPKAKKKA
jgi:hypothetical protein